MANDDDGECNVVVLINDVDDDIVWIAVSLCSIDCGCYCDKRRVFVVI